MIGVIPNPSKKVTVEYPLSQVKQGFENLPKVVKKFKLHQKNDMFNGYVYDVSEFLSLGVYIDVNLSSVNDNRTEINIEVRRKLGAFDQWVEVQNASEHISNIIEILPKCMLVSGDQVSVLEKEESKKNTPLWVKILIAGVVLGVLNGLLT